ncbi:unnamed protein product [Adineta ricciae]|uniref:Voltage-gated hydrogen channel 1 n=1 Tax=Adineta ricciae TaxID=249248 RepID=A0A814JV91_ADIRI|nr:unnamed protein product [Adineta ricciae]
MDTIGMKSSKDLINSTNLDEKRMKKSILKESKWKIIRESNPRILPRLSQVIIDLIVVLIDLVLAQLSSPCLTDNEMLEYNTTHQRDSCFLPYSLSLSRGELFLFYFSVLLLIIFVIEILLSFYTFGLRHYTNPLYLIDSLIVFTSFVMELYFHYGHLGRAGRAAAAIVVLRLWKIVRAIHAVVHSISLKNRIIIKKIQEAQIIIEQEKEMTEKMLQKQDIKVEYLTNLLKINGKLPSNEQINSHVEKLWRQRSQSEILS